MAEGNGHQVIRERQQHLMISWNTRKESYQTLILILLQEMENFTQAWKGLG